MQPPRPGIIRAADRAQLPSSTDWAIGLLVGIDLLFAGWGLFTVSGLGKRLAAT